MVLAGTGSFLPQWENTCLYKRVCVQGTQSLPFPKVHFLATNNATVTVALPVFHRLVTVKTEGSKKLAVTESGCGRMPRSAWRRAAEA